jgi:hypothetical protein
MLKQLKGKSLSRTQMKQVVGGSLSGGCRTDVCTRTQGCCPGLACALLPQAGTNIRGVCVSLEDDGF